MTEFRVRPGRFDTIPQPESRKTELRELIAMDGVITPLVVWGNGEIIDGHSRFAIAEELGVAITVPPIIKDVSEAEGHRLAWQYNKCHTARLTKKQRNEHVAMMLANGWTQQQVADEMGVTQGRVAQIESGLSSSLVTNELDSKSAPKYHRAAKPDASAALSERIRTLLAQGLTQKAIGEQVGISFSGVSWRVKHHKLNEPLVPTIGPTLVEQIAEMASTGHDSRQIAAELGITRDLVKTRAKDNGITITADDIKRGTRVVELNAAMDRGVESVAMSLHPFRFIDFSQLDPERAEEWSRSLNESAKQIRTLIRQINQLAKEQDQHGAV